MNHSLWTLSWICMVMGSLMAVGGRISDSRRKQQEPYKGRAEATVIEIVAGEPDRRGREAGIHDYYYPMLAFYAKGRLIKKVYPDGGNPCRYRLNQKLKLYYDEKNPEHCKISGKDRKKTISASLYYGGYGLLGLGAVLFCMYAGRFFLPFQN